MQIKEIIFFCYGDSNNASTWSNVPFLFTKTLENKGIVIRRVNLLRKNIFIRIYNKLLKNIYNFIYPNHVYEYIRTPLYRKKAFSIIKEAVETYKNADCCIFTCFDFWNKYNNIPTLLFCDWTYDILILERLGRKPYYFETRYSKWQDEAINSSSAVISLFPECAQSMRTKYPQANILYLGGNVVNNLYGKDIDVNKVIETKQHSKRILFIGGKKYIDGCRLLIEAHKILVNNGIKCEVDIVGMTSSDFKDTEIPDTVHFHGYLKKDDKDQCDLYYRLILNASVFVNPTELWAGYSSTIEAMYFYTPIIISPYKDFVSEFGAEINFGLYNSEFNAKCLSTNIERILNDPDYLDKCINAHNVTKNYTWNTYVDKVLNVIEQIKNK